MKRPTKFLVDNILAFGSVNLVDGESGAGKTRFVLQEFVVHYLAGGPILGHGIMPGCKILYISLDRGREAFLDVLWQLSIPVDSFVWECVTDGSLGDGKLDSLQKKLKQHFGEDYKNIVLIIDGIEMLPPCAGTSGMPNAREVASYLTALNGWAGRRNLVLIGITQGAKERGNNIVKGERHTAYGNVYWGARTETMITLSCTKNKRERIAKVKPHRGPAFELTYAFNDHGELVLSENIDDIVHQLDFVGSLDPNERYSAGDLQKRAAASEAGYSRATFYRHLKQWVQNGQLRQDEDGFYSRAF